MKETGGPAFPRDSFTDEKTGLIVKQEGMTLRDWFAGQYLIGMGNPNIRIPISIIARECYQLADAMLAERNKED